MLEQSRLWIERSAGGVELAAAVIIGLAAVEAVWHAMPLFIRRRDGSLRFAADILRTAVAPSWRDIGQLAAIAVLRTGLNYGLEREIAREERRDFTCATRASSG